MPSPQQSGLLSLLEIPFQQNVAAGDGPAKKRCYFGSFKARMCMKTKETWTKWPRRSRTFTAIWR